MRVGAFLVAGAVLLAPAQAVRTIYVTVTSAAGGPAAGLEAPDFSVREGGRPTDILRVAPAAGRLQVVVVLDDNGTGSFRQATTTFVEQTIDHADVAIVRIVGQPLTLAPLGSSPRALAAAVATLGPIAATPDGGQLLSGIDEATRTLTRAEASRPVILAMTVGGEEHSSLEARDVLDRLAKSGAALFVIAVLNPSDRQRVRIVRPSDLLGPNMHLAQVLGDGPRLSGGFRQELQTTGSVVAGVREVLGALRQQYAVTYALRGAVTPSRTLDVSVTTPGLTVRAPIRAPAP